MPSKLPKRTRGVANTARAAGRRCEEKRAGQWKGQLWRATSACVAMAPRPVSAQVKDGLRPAAAAHVNSGATDNSRAVGAQKRAEEA